MWIVASAAFVCSLRPTPANAQMLGADRPQIKGPLTLAQAVQTGLRENLMVRASQADVKAAAAATGIARSQRLPQLSATTYLTYGDFSNIFNTAPNVTPVNNLAVPSQGYADQNLTLSVPLYTSSRLEQQVRAASERERAAVLDVGGMQAETTLRIKDAYYRTLLAAENVKVAQARVDAAAELVKTTQALFAAGKGLESSVRRVEAEQADAQRTLTTARNTQAKALLDLKAAMGVRLDSDFTVSDALTFTPPSGDLAAQLTDAGRFRPELLSARARLSAAGHQTGAVRGSQGPQVYGMAMADGLASHPSGTREGYTVGLVISLPLLDGGQRRAETAQARAQEERALAEERDLELRVSNEVQQAWLDVQTAAENYHTAQVALQAAQSAYDVTTLRVQNEKALLVEELDALAALTQARGNVAQALYDHSLAVAQLQRAVGRP
ncbi:MAG: outer rane efflux protein [Chthonomonadaceae bacterium]|nr:outer rane efflux protein [Chthonomonadaceae bacterium]